MRILSVALAAVLALPAFADTKSDLDRDHKPDRETGELAEAARPSTTTDPVTRFIEANVLETLYHELGHALIDTMALPVFGPEEFAADFFAAYMLDRMHDEAITRQLILDVAHAYAMGEQQDRWNGESTAMWDVHGKPMQRYYNLTCLYYGADADARDWALDQFDLPEHRAESCSGEFEMAATAWEQVLTDLAADAPGDSIRLDWVLNSESHLTRFVKAEVAALNDILVLPDPITVSVIPCGEVNAFYDPGAREILICTELSDHLAELAP